MVTRCEERRSVDWLAGNIFIAFLRAPFQHSWTLIKQQYIVIFMFAADMKYPMHFAASCDYN